MTAAWCAALAVGGPGPDLAPAIGSGLYKNAVTVSANCTITLPATACTLTFSTPGAHTISATYNGDVNFNASPASSSVTQTVGTPIFLPFVGR